MSDGSGIARRTIERRTAIRAGVAIAALILISAILSPSLLTTNPPAPTDAALATTGPSSSARIPTGTAGPTEEPWEDLGAGAPYQPAAELTPIDRDRIGAAPDTAFTLRSFTGTPAVELARDLVAKPPVKLAVEAGATPDVAIVRPASALEPSTRYRFRLESDGVVAGSWIYVTRGPLHVTTTLPGDKAVAVPVNTGIELTFDQDQTTGVEARFSIEPKAEGRFEQHGRTWSFIPEQPLSPATIYTVTLQRGVAVTGSDGVLEEPVTFRFETSAPGPSVSAMAFGRTMLEVRPNQQPDVTVYQVDGDEGIPNAITVHVNRLPGFDALVDAARRLMGRDAWAIAAPSAVVETDGLTQVAEVKATLIETDVQGALHIPVKLARGDYVLTLEQPGPPAQLLLQVTDLSAYTQVATSTTFVWVNDIPSDTGIANATVAIAGGASLGATAADGLLQVETPQPLLKPTGRLFDDEATPQQVTLLTVAAPDGRRLLVPIGMAVDYAYWRYEGGYGGANADWFVAFDSGRTTFRRTDVANVFGVVRARSDRSVPTGVAVVLRAEGSPIEAAITREPVTLTKRGVFTANVHIDDLPAGTYYLDLLVGDTSVATIWIGVTEIRKPAYELGVETERHAFLAGESVAVAATATFFDGTPVPGVELNVEAFDRSSGTITTDALGAAKATITDATAYGPDGWSTQYVAVRPARPEEGQITGEALVTVFPSTRWLAAEGSLTDGRIVVDGTLSNVDLDAVEARLVAGLDVGDPAGGPVAGGTVKARVVQEVLVRTKIGTSYDFIEKVVVPLYQYDTKEVEVASPTLTSRPDGTFHLSVPAPSIEDAYEVRLTATDAQGRLSRLIVYVASRREHVAGNTRPYLGQLGSCGFTPDLVVHLDGTVDATMHDGDGSVATGGRFLFLVAKPGSVNATLQDAATFVRTLRDADLPGYDVRGVWFSDGTYFVADVRAVVDPRDKTLKVTLDPDHARYAPGGQVTVQVRTLDASGKPVPADVILQGIDEKLFKLGYANDVDLLSELLASPPAGFVTSYRSHDIPTADEGGCGDEGGGRENFSDTVTFQRITTGADGRGTAEFTLSDDLTSWRLGAAAVSGNLDAGFASVNIPVGLPFFVDSTLAPEYLVGEGVVLRARTFGGALGSNDEVRITVSSASLGMAPVTVTGAAFSSLRVQLPPMTAGDHQIRIAAEATIGGKHYTDALIRTIHVVTTRLLVRQASYDPLDASFKPQGGVGLTSYVITDAGRAALIEPLERLSSSTSSRFDSATAAELARRLLVKQFGWAQSSFGDASYDVTRWSQRGVALLPYSSVDIFLTARAALLAPDLVDAQETREALEEWADDES
ncbi:MAG TPA: Ig-like domain-containing protein, partial [Candidatus Limnocylindrales bacterium]|nr:Ig-like domain-containing protein [Candidatus Limnocylindrales bacterium]